jgi:endoribonuclease L-PSP, putative
MSKEIINTASAPAPIGPYSQAVKAGGFLFVSGQIPINPQTNELVTSSATDEAHQVMKNIQAILHEAGLNFSHIVKTTIFLSDMGLFAPVNEVYSSYFRNSLAAGESGFPAREAIAVKTLPKNVNVEISVIAVIE